MNREIKFRAWNGSKMLFRNLLDRNWYASPYNDDNGCNTVQECKPSDGRWNIMQYTGLKDRHGKEIYEGDILKNWQQGWNVVVYKSPSFEATVSKDQSSSYTMEWWNETEVIGNIYANPELLTTKL